MMGHQPRRELLFHYFSLEDQVPADHLLRLIDRYVDFSFVRDRLHPTYSETGRPSIDPEVLVRVLLIGYLYGITSERRLMDEIRMHLAYRWFTGLGFDQPIPDHSTVSKHRHGRFRESGVFREIFEEIVARCQAAGLVDGRHLSVDGTLVHADASRQPRVSRSAEGVRTLEAHLADVDQQNPVAAPRRRAKVSPTDPDAAWATKGGPATFAYFDHYLVDTASRIILDVDASPARFREESLAARRYGRPGHRPWSPSHESRGRQGLWERRVPDLAARPQHPAPHSRDRSPPPNGGTLYARRLPLRARRERVHLSRRATVTLPGRGSPDPGARVLLDSRAVPRVSAKRPLHLRCDATRHRALARTGSPNNPRARRRLSARNGTANSSKACLVS